MQRQLGGPDGSGLAITIVETLTLEQQRGSMELQPLLEHVALGKDERRLAAPGIDQIFDHCAASLLRGNSSAAAYLTVTAVEAAKVCVDSATDLVAPSTQR
jgi:hypothetical protein